MIQKQPPRLSQVAKAAPLLSRPHPRPLHPPVALPRPPSTTDTVNNADTPGTSAPPAIDINNTKAKKKTKKDMHPPPKLIGKLKQLQPAVASQHVKL